MTSRRFAMAAGAAVIVITILPLVIGRLAPQPGLTRSLYANAAFEGPPAEARTSEINLRFLDDQPELPRQHFSARWRGYFYLAEPQTVEFWVGGDDEVQLRVDGELVLSRSLYEGMGTRNRSVALDAGSHALAIDYKQFGGNLRLNIQRALARQQPGPFLPTELYVEPLRTHHVWLLITAHRLRAVTPLMWLALAVAALIAYAPRKPGWWRVAGQPRSTREYAARLWWTAAPALLAPAVVFAVGSHTIYTNNPGEFSVSFQQLAAPWLLRAVAINWLILFAVGSVLALVSANLTRLYAAVLFALGLALWAQGNLWHADYGVLAGRDVDLAQHAARAPYELAALAGILALGALFFRPVSRIAAFASMAFLSVQAVAAAVTDAGPAEHARWVEPPADIYRFSRDRNVVHIVLDEFQGDVFTEILQQDRPVLDKTFSGFTYFADHTSAFPTTSMSMPAMLTGREYRNQQPAPEFAREAFKVASIFDKVNRAGYDIDAMSIVPIASFEDWLGPESSPNWRGSRFRIRKPFISQGDYREVTSRYLLELSLFRHVPHSAKELSVTHPDWFYAPIWMDRGETPAQIRRHEASNSAAFLGHFTERIGTGRDRPVYKLIHVGVPHRPIVVNRDCRFIGGTAMSRDSYREQSRCAVRLVGALLDRLRAVGIYDSSLIIVSSDHGTDLEPMGFNGSSDSLSLLPGPSTSRLPATVGSAKAIMFIKPPQSTGPIAVSQAPTTHIDLQPTILDILKLPAGSPDQSMLRRDPAQSRTRIYGMYDPRQRFPKGFLDRIDLLTIDGPTIDAASWHVQRSIWNPAQRLDGQEIDVGPRDAHRYLGPGWSFEKREPDGGSDLTYAQAITPKVVIYSSLPSSAVQFVMRASTAPGPEPESIAVNVDGREVATVKAAGNGYRELSVNVPADPRRPTISEITLHLRGTGTPMFKLDRLRIDVSP